jgi:alpha/beta superfamily hydrolase
VFEDAQELLKFVQEGRDAASRLTTTTFGAMVSALLAARAG